MTNTDQVHFDTEALARAVDDLNAAKAALQRLLEEGPSSTSADDQSAQKGKFEGYSDEEWAAAVAVVDAANTAVLGLRRQKGAIDLVYGAALAVQRAALSIRDDMIDKDPRSADVVGPRANVTRVRACQVRAQYKSKRKRRARKPRNAQPPVAPVSEEAA